MRVIAGDDSSRRARAARQPPSTPPARVLRSRATAMDPKRIRELLEAVQRRTRRASNSAVAELKDLPFADLGLRGRRPPPRAPPGRARGDPRRRARPPSRSSASRASSPAPGRTSSSRASTKDKAHEVTAALPELKYKELGAHGDAGAGPRPGPRHAAGGARERGHGRPAGGRGVRRDAAHARRERRARVRRRRRRDPPPPSQARRLRRGRASSSSSPGWRARCRASSAGWSRGRSSRSRRPSGTA